MSDQVWILKTVEIPVRSSREPDKSKYVIASCAQPLRFVIEDTVVKRFKQNTNGVSNG